ncbi:hypothetical protein V6Z11_D09G218100 [Gossypium hirsutum]
MEAQKKEKSVGKIRTTICELFIEESKSGKR